MPKLDSDPPPTPDAGPPAGEPRPEREILARHRALELVSVALIAIGIVLPAAVLVANPDILSAGQTLDAAQRLLGPILLLGLGGLLLVAGLVTHAVRAVIVRAALPPGRYRGPAILALLALAVILGTLLSLGAASTALAIADGGDLSPGGTLLLLTATQIGLLAITGGLVVAPRALAGVRLLPATGLARSLGLGLVIAVPAWLAATLLAALSSAVLQRLGVTDEGNIVDSVLNRGDPLVLVLAVVIVAPVAEELFFRGVVYNAWERERGPRVAVLGSAALFAVVHASLFSLLPIFVLGVVLALLYRSTRSLPATMLTHATFNAISVAITLLARQGLLPLPT